MDPTALDGMTSLLGTIQGLYPHARITSGYRGPNNPLTLRNPASMHAMGSPSDPRAVDVAPIPGVNFNDYVSSVKKAGVPIAQAFDEASHPFPWTTGPNWHLASASASPQPQAMGNTNPSNGPYYKPQQGANPYTAGQNHDPLAPLPGDTSMPPQQPPASLGQMAGPNIGADPNAASLQYQGPSLASLATMPNVKQPSKFTAGNILGTLGDALSAYGGKAPTFGPFLREQQMMDKQQNFEREKFNQELQMRMIAMMNPPDVMDAKVIGALPPAQQRQYLRVQDMKNPLYTTLNGSQVLQRRVTDPPAEAVAHLRGAIGAGGDQAGEFAKFNQIFGPGAAEEALGAQ